jgi:hypothetical protein
MVASWKTKKDSIPLSKLAANILMENGVLRPDDLDNHETAPFVIQNNRWDPVTGTASAFIGVGTGMVDATKTMLVDPFTGPQQVATSTAAYESTKTPNGADYAGHAVGSFAKGFGKFTGGLYKGFIVDLPLATTEGFRNIPRLYGEEVKDHGEVTGVMSGFQVGGKNFVHSLADGLSDPFKQTYAGGKKEGALGYAKGFGKGMAGLVTKTGSAALGIVAYPGDGICKSLRYMAKSKTRKQVRMSKLAETEGMGGKSSMDVNAMALVQEFGRLRKGKGKEKE